MSLTDNPVYVPLIALVGRPNVGKSTLFNKLVRRRDSLVFDEPGVTRDRIFGEMHIDKHLARVVDTGGLDFGAQDPMVRAIQQQTELAIEAADFVLVVVDGQHGLNVADKDVVALLRRANKPMALLVNKVDVPSHEWYTTEFHGLGVQDIFPISAEHRRGLDAVESLLTSRLQLPETMLARPEKALAETEMQARELASDACDDATDAQPADSTETEACEQTPALPSQVEWQGGPIHVAVIGRPNAGKSSLINQILGQERHLAADVPGTTRDAVDSHVHIDGQHLVFIDTAGIRRKRSIYSRLEQFAVVAAFNSMDRADITLVVLDGTVPPTDQDARIAALAHDKGKGIVVVINKWDLVTNPEWRERYIKALHLQLPFLSYAPIVKLSAKTGRGLSGLFKYIHATQQERHRRVGTGELNRFFRQRVVSHPPPVRGGKRPQLYFVSQPMVRPPTFVFATSRAKDLHVSYKRYLQNALRKQYGFEGTPVWLKFRAHNEPRQ